MEKMFAVSYTYLDNKRVCRQIPTLPVPELPGSGGMTTAFGPKLCRYCSKLFAALEGTFDWRWEWGEYVQVELAPTLSEFLGSLRSGCQLCHIIQRTIRANPSDAEAFEGLSFWLKEYSWRSTPRSCNIDIYAGDSFVVSLWGCITAESGPEPNRSVENDPGCYSSLYEAESMTTDDPKAWELCQYWVKRCLESHTRCGSNEVTPWWPTRLLYIGGPCDENDSLVVRVEETTTNHPGGPYMTLSHCWGNGDDFLKLTIETHDHLLSGIPLAQFPKSFKDAIRLTRSLGVDYLWIDSLCIIQNSPNNHDWIQESGTMTKVYQHSLCNIAVTASVNPSGGCFHPRDPLAVRHLRVTLRTPREGEDGRKTVNETYLFGQSRMWEMAIEEAPLNQRAWVIQERLLSRRQIHCSQDQLLWECLEKAACEAFPDDFEAFYKVRSTGKIQLSTDMKRLDILLLEIQKLRSEATQDLSDFFRAELLPDKRVLYRSSDKVLEMTQSSLSYPSERQRVENSLPERLQIFIDEVYQCWVILVERYTACHLSFRTDKLIAISGVATLIQNALMGVDIYVAGLWLKHLPYQLLWHRKYDVGDLGESRYDLAPSWSWASCAAPVSGPPTPFVPPYWYSTIIADITQVSLAQEGQTLGGVATAEIQVRCLLLKIQKREVCEQSIYFIRCTPCQHEEDASAEAMQVDFSDLDRYLDNEQASHHLDQAYIVPIERPQRGALQTAGIIVAPLENDTFRRIGYWDANMINNDSEEPNEFGITNDFLQYLHRISNDDKCTITLV